MVFQLQHLKRSRFLFVVINCILWMLNHRIVLNMHVLHEMKPEKINPYSIRLLMVKGIQEKKI
ncbi:hypothetical protein NECAME_02666 [Necator americanus]|uniref:Uncharacterized protein n=1 Tax=Necator americanus TaxID=51031 RepID=W2TB18_NECAM|nr:hypothetical protein NECAME_02666 [Necator americanus]ETN79240.1 hypothetical protein NECAME_02666 [Necator americanus]